MEKRLRELEAQAKEEHGDDDGMSKAIIERLSDDDLDLLIKVIEEHPDELDGCVVDPSTAPEEVRGLYRRWCAIGEQIERGEAGLTEIQKQNRSRLDRVLSNVRSRIVAEPAGVHIYDPELGPDPDARGPVMLPDNKREEQR